MSNRERSIKALSEIVLRVRNLKEMQEFYESVLGLEMLDRFDNAIFFRIASGFDGQTQSLVLLASRRGPIINSATIPGWISKRQHFIILPLPSACRIT
jgi:catechol 2,3-dioxygenase-like lactoylglutathione lyase family enzyme